MEYNWSEIFKEKTDKELYEIFKGRTTLLGNPQIFAEEELKRRGFNFNDLRAYNKKNELLRLIEEERSTDGLFGPQSSDMLNFIRYSLLLFLVLVFLIILFSWESFIESGADIIFFFSLLLAILTGGVIYSFRKYKKAVKKEDERKRRINELIKDLK